MTLTLLPQPGPRPGALLPAGLDLRPCVTHNPLWWDTGNPHNHQAIKLCGTCPWQDHCAPVDGRDAAGTIRAGTAYDDYGKPAAGCTVCGGLILEAGPTPRCVNGHGGTAADHHHTIARMIADGASMRDIGAAIGLHHGSVSRYWTLHLNSNGKRVMRVGRLPGVPDGCTTNKPRDWHDHVEAMLTDLDAAHTYHEVAHAIGSTGDAVKAYWQRVQRARAKAGLPTLNRRSVSNRADRGVDRTQVPA
ncbi:helix-turn-helix domain-containing protein [Micromonospora sp. NPDC023956]|uniref:helix-turn-helix domain-containing protein n=1 Tax=Micromonospora sp. NPDC023956 TaxID=3155722 RepID=UPI0033D57954